jgi:hypothetical protein
MLKPLIEINILELLSRLQISKISALEAHGSPTNSQKLRTKTCDKTILGTLSLERFIFTGIFYIVNLLWMIWMIG